MMRRVLLCILDGWGERVLDENNGLLCAKNWHQFLEKYPHTFLNASESFVGLPDGQMGNSEVGHMTLGLGRVIDQVLPRINKAINNKRIDTYPALLDFIAKIKKSTNCCHVVGLLSPGGVHSHQDHLFYIIKVLSAHGINVVVHPILDGRDTPPQSAKASLDQLEELCIGNVKAGSLSGRYYAMDRDNRWDRTEKAYNAMVLGKGKNFTTINNALSQSYAHQIYDEFVEPCVIDSFSGIAAGDSLFFVNFRADRARQLMSAFVLPEFNTFQQPFSCALTMTEYSNALSAYHSILFEAPSVSNSLGEVIQNHDLCQLRIAETEKYAHVTYFFNGGVEPPLKGEDRILIPSPKVTTYDLKPEMSAKEVTENVISALHLKKHQLVVVNYANPDMVGHTGIRPAIEKAISTIDSILIELEHACLNNDWLLIITADHGNVEQVVDDEGQPHTAHTLNPVPFLVINGEKDLAFREKGTLADVAPSILRWLNLPVPQQMSGKQLQEG